MARSPAYGRRTEANFELSAFALGPRDGRAYLQREPATRSVAKHRLQARADGCAIGTVEVCGDLSQNFNGLLPPRRISKHVRPFFGAALDAAHRWKAGFAHGHSELSVERRMQAFP